MTTEHPSGHLDDAAAELAALLNAPDEELDTELAAHLTEGPLGPALEVARVHVRMVSTVYGPQHLALDGLEGPLGEAAAVRVLLGDPQFFVSVLGL